jgi:hypothetical protein
MDASIGASPSGEPFRGQILLLRGRAGLTQRAFAAHLCISEHAIYKWEAVSQPHAPASPHRPLPGARCLHDRPRGRGGGGAVGGTAPGGRAAHAPLRCHLVRPPGPGSAGGGRQPPATPGRHAHRRDQFGAGPKAVACLGRSARGGRVPGPDGGSRGAQALAGGGAMPGGGGVGPGRHRQDRPGYPHRP